MSLTLQNGSDFILVLKLTDIKKKPMRVADTVQFSLRLYTDDPDKALVFSKRDVLTDGEFDRIPIDSEQLETLRSGVLIYNYSYAVFNSDFSATEQYDKVKTVYTDVYWQNNGSLTGSTNVVTWELIQKLQKAIDDCEVNCAKEMAQLKNYMATTFTDRMEEAETNIADILATIVLIENNIENSGKDITKINEIIDEIRTKITENVRGIEDVNYRVDALKAKTETVQKEFDSRLDVAERKLNVINDSNDNTPGSLANVSKDAKLYADNLFKDVRNGLVTEEDLEKVKAEIPVVNRNLSAYNNDCGFISDTEIFNQFYTKSESDNQHKVTEDKIADIESYAARKDEVTQVFDESGELIRIMHISAEPDYYNQQEVDDLLSGLKSELTEEDTKISERLSRLHVTHTEDVVRLDSSIQELQSEIDVVNSDIDDINSSVTNIKSDINDINSDIEDVSNRVKVVEDFDHSVYALKDDVDSSIKEIEEDIVDINSNIDDVSNRVKTLEAIDHNVYALKDDVDSSLSDLKEELDTNFGNIDSSLANINSDIEDVSNRVKTLEEFDHSIYAIKVDVNSKFVEVERNITDISARVKTLEDFDYDQFQTKTDFNSSFIAISDDIADVSNRVKTLEDFDHSVYVLTEDLEENYYDKNYIDNELLDIQGIVAENKEDIEGKLSNAKSELQSSISGIDSRVQVLEAIDHNQYALKYVVDASFGEFETKIENVKSELETEIQNIDLSDYYTKSEIDQKLTEIDVTDQLSDYATISYVDGIKSELKSEIQNIDLSEFAKKSEIPTDYAHLWYGTYNAYLALGTYNEQTIYVIKG